MPLAVEDHLRLLLGERIPEGGLDTDTFFTDDEVESLLETTGGNINLAASLGWRAKAAEFAKYIDIDESGSTRKLSQMYRQADLQANYFAKIADVDTEALTQLARGGIVARTSQWAVPPDQGIAREAYRSHGHGRHRA